MEITLGINNEQLETKPAPGKWSIKDNIAHLARYQSVFLQRIDTILYTNLPYFEPYNADIDIEFEAWQDQELQLILSYLNNDRLKIIKVITQLDEQALKSAEYMQSLAG